MPCLHTSAYGKEVTAMAEIDLTKLIAEYEEAHLQRLQRFFGKLEEK